MAKKVSENVLVVNFKRDSQAYQAFSELKEAFVDNNYFISQAAIVKKEDGEIRQMIDEMHAKLIDEGWIAAEDAQ